MADRTNTIPHRALAAWRRAPVATALTAFAILCSAAPAGMIAGYIFGWAMGQTWAALFGGDVDQHHLQFWSMLWAALAMLVAVVEMVSIAVAVATLTDREARHG